MKNIKKIVSILITLLLAFSLQGCAIGDFHIYASSTSGIGNVFKIGSMTCSKKEFRVYLANYKNLYGTFDDISLWDSENVDIMEEAVKSAVLNHLTKVYCFNQYAKDNDIKLSSDEENLCEKAAEEYYNSLNSQEKSYMHASCGDIEKMYKKYALAEKVYFKLMNSVDDEVSEDEARVMDAYVMCVEKEKTANDVYVQLKAGASFENLAGTYTILDSVKMSFGRNEFPKEVDDVVFRMENGQISEPIETDDGYYIIYCVNKYNKELSESNKANVIANRKKDLINDLVSDQEEKYYSHFSESTLRNIEINKNEEIKTDSFFEVLNKNLKFS